ncbi:MAG: OsmC family protein [Thiobacillus sp.]
MSTINGVNLDQLVSTVEAIKTNPSLANFKFRSTTDWVEGGYSRTTIQNFFGVGQEDTSRTESFIVHGDEPHILLGTNKGPNAVEAVLSALASCLSVGFAYNAAAQGIKLDALSFQLEGDIDLRGFLGLSDQVSPGYSNIRVTCRIDSDASKDKVDALIDHVKRTSPVLDIIQRAVPVAVVVEASESRKEA